MTKQEYFNFAEAFFKKAIDIGKAKNADYTGGSDDPFANFTGTDPEWTEIGFMTRMNDKFQRVKSFIKKGELQVKNESVADSLLDLANYCVLFAGYLESKKPRVLRPVDIINHHFEIKE